MEFYYDLIPSNKIKNTFWRIFALVIIIVTATVPIVMYFTEGKYLMAALWTVWGILLFYQIYIGKPIDALFGKKYIHITEKFITIKPKLLKKAITIQWDDLESIKMKPTYLVVKSKSGDEINIDFKQIDYLAVQDMKSLIKTLIEKWKVNLVA